MTTEGKTIVVVNDDRSILELMREILEEESYGVMVADDSDRACRLIKETLPTLAILDVRMPGSPDWQVLDAIKRDLTTASLPVLVCSASAREMQAAEVRLRAQGCDLLYMPFDVDVLLEKVSQLTS
jgi:DNA-binding response OmpR family regulator